MHSDKSFVLKDVGGFSWTIEKRNSYYFSKETEFKIGSCKVKWKMILDASDGCYVNIGFQGENLGLHTGILAFKVYQPRTYYSSSPSIADRSIQVTKNDKAMKNVRFQLDDFFRQGNVISGTITVSNCDCIPNPNKEKLLDENVSQLQNDIHSQWKKNFSPDVEIKVGKTCFNAHKFILRARSPVFAKMLEHDMKENQDNCITVADTSGKIMKNFMSFLYSGILEDNSFSTVIGLYALADKYEVTSLQKTCRSLLISKISESTVLEILKTSDLHTDEELKQKATQFICGKFSKIEVSPEWSSLIDSDTRLASYVLRFVSKKCSSNN